MTILGQHTIAEVVSLLKAKDYEHDKIAELYATLTPAQKALDTAWPLDWAGFLARYAVGTAPVRVSTASAVLSLTPNKLIPAEAEWQIVLRTLSKTPGSVTEQDEQGLFTRLIKMGAVPDLKNWNVPQPDKADDVDLGIFKGADDLKKLIEKKTSDLSPANNPFTYAAIGAAVALGLFLAIRR